MRKVLIFAGVALLAAWLAIRALCTMGEEVEEDGERAEGPPGVLRAACDAFRKLPDAETAHMVLGLVQTVLRQDAERECVLSDPWHG